MMLDCIGAYGDMLRLFSKPRRAIDGLAKNGDNLGGFSRRLSARIKQDANAVRAVASDPNRRQIVALVGFVALTCWTTVAGDVGISRNPVTHLVAGHAISNASDHPAELMSRDQRVLGLVFTLKNMNVCTANSSRMNLYEDVVRSYLGNACTREFSLPWCFNFPGSHSLSRFIIQLRFEDNLDRLLTGGHQVYRLLEIGQG
jgi:hypothetical protein